MPNTAFEWITQFDDAHIRQLLTFYAKESWTKGRDEETVIKLVKGSDILIGCCKNGALIGFARVLTDYTLKAMIYDVIVRQDHRGHKIGDAIIDQIINHPELKDVQHFELYCPDHLSGFYERFGFQINSSHLMRLTHQ